MKPFLLFLLLDELEFGTELGTELEFELNGFLLLENTEEGFVDAGGGIEGGVDADAWDAWNPLRVKGKCFLAAW